MDHSWPPPFALWYFFRLLYFLKSQTSYILEHGAHVNEVNTDQIHSTDMATSCYKHLRIHHSNYLHHSTVIFHIIFIQLCLPYTIWIHFKCLFWCDDVIVLKTCTHNLGLTVFAFEIVICFFPGMLNAIIIKAPYFVSKVKIKERGCTQCNICSTLK